MILQLIFLHVRGESAQKLESLHDNNVFKSTLPIRQKVTDVDDAGATRTNEANDNVISCEARVPAKRRGLS